MHLTASPAALHPEDAALEAAYPPVPYDSREWDEEDDHWVCNDADLIYTRTLTMKFFDVAALPDPTPDQNWKGRTDAVTLLAPIAGGSDDEPPIIEAPFEPSEEDWADNRAWCETVDRIDAFNAERVDG
jgi:hypothetical protein